MASHVHYINYRFGIVPVLIHKDFCNWTGFGCDEEHYKPCTDVEYKIVWYIRAGVVIIFVIKIFVLGVVTVVVVIVRGTDNNKEIIKDENNSNNFY